jgi:hypothetical protein
MFLLVTLRGDVDKRAATIGAGSQSRLRSRRGISFERGEEEHAAAEFLERPSDQIEEGIRRLATLVSKDQHSVTVAEKRYRSSIASRYADKTISRPRVPPGAAKAQTSISSVERGR